MDPDAFLERFGAIDVAPRPDERPAEFHPTPFKHRDLSAFPRRQFIYGRHYIRQFLSATAAGSGVGKSSLSIAEIVAMTSGRSLLGLQPIEPLRVWYWNGEDPAEEIQRRIEAACLHFGVDPSEIEGRLFIDSGRDTEIIIAEQTRERTRIAVPVEGALVAALTKGKFDVLILDPVIATHRVSENDNMAIDAVAKTFGRIAGRANCAVEGIHHVRKTNGADVRAEDSRGASAWVAAARSVRVLNRMSEKEAEQGAILSEDRRFYFRSEIDKANLAPPAKATWFRLMSVPLGNGSETGMDDQDYVGVASPWKWPDAFADVKLSDLRAVQTRVASGHFRENTQSKDWVGYQVADVLDLKRENRTDLAKVRTLLKSWYASGALVIVQGIDEKRKQRSFVEVGTPAHE